MRWFGLLLFGSVLTVCVVFLAKDAPPMARRLAVGSPVAAEPPPLKEADIRRVFASGVVEGTQRDVALRFELTGRLKIVHVREGDLVAKGDVLAQLDSQIFEQRVAEAEAKAKLARAERDRLINGAREETREVLRADVRSAQIQVNEAEALFGRSKALAQRTSVSAQDLDDHRFKYEKAVANLHAVRAKLTEIDAPARRDDVSIADARISLAEATLRHERSMLDKTLLRAPNDGVVLHVLIEAGELVGPEDDRSLITVTNRNRTRIRAYIEELDALAVKVGQKAWVAVDGNPRQKYPGSVLSCSPFVRGKSQRHHKPGELVDIKVREVVVELNDGSDLIVGLPVDVFILPAGYSSDERNDSPRQESVPAKSSLATRNKEIP